MNENFKLFTAMSLLKKVYETIKHGFNSSRIKLTRFSIQISHPDLRK